MEEPCFLTLDEVLALHADQMDRYGGSGGLRDLEAEEDELVELVLGVARGRVGKAQVGVFLKEHVVRSR